MSDYITITELDYFLLSAAEVNPNKKAFAITAASRYFDRLAEVDEDFFKVADANATDKIIQGSGLSLLNLPPYVGNLGTVVLDEIEIDSDSFVKKGNAPNQYIDFGNYYNLYLNKYISYYFRSKGLSEPYTISARWGWTAVPHDVKAGVAEIAIALCNGLDIARAITLEESYAKLPMVAPNGFADRAARYYRERLMTIGI